MGKATVRNEHDWIMVTARFDGGSEFKAKWNRAGSDVTLNPRDPAVAKTLSLIMSQAAKLPGMTVGRIAGEIERVATASRTLQDCVEGLKSALGVSGELPKPAAGPQTARITLRKSRGWEVSGTFPSGERFEIKVNKSSVGLQSDPSVSSRDSDLVNIVFAMKAVGIMDDEEIAARLKETAEESHDMDAWIEAARGIMAPALRR